MTICDITVYYRDGTVEEYRGGYQVRGERVHIYTDFDGVVKIPFMSIKKYIVK